jgi:hypothetical protein
VYFIAALFIIMLIQQRLMQYDMYFHYALYIQDALWSLSVFRAPTRIASQQPFDLITTFLRYAELREGVDSICAHLRLVTTTPTARTTGDTTSGSSTQRVSRDDNFSPVQLTQYGSVYDTATAANGTSDTTALHKRRFRLLHLILKWHENVVMKQQQQQQQAKQRSVSGSSSSSSGTSSELSDAVLQQCKACANTAMLALCTTGTPHLIYTATATALCPIDTRKLLHSEHNAVLGCARGVSGFSDGGISVKFTTHPEGFSGSSSSTDTVDTPTGYAMYIHYGVAPYHQHSVATSTAGASTGEC